MLTRLTAALKRSPGLILPALFLVGLRLSVWRHFTMKWYHPFYSLAFEVAAIAVLLVVVRGGLAGRIAARVALGALLFVELAQTVSFHLIKGYWRGYQFTNVSFDEVRDAVYAQALHPYGLLGLAACIGAAMLFGRTGSLERAALKRWMIVLALPLLAAGFVLHKQFYAPELYPVFGHSPVGLLLATRTEPRFSHRHTGVVHAEDWAPAVVPTPAWAHLATTTRNFNIVVIVLESVRYDVFWPAASAPPMPRVASLASRAALFTRAYAHDPRSIKALEALTFGLYPAPRWEPLSLEHPDIVLDSVPDRWSKLGLRSAFFQNYDISSDGEDELLAKRGYELVQSSTEMNRIDPNGADRTLAIALDRFVGQAPARRFGVVLWTRQTHLPYGVPAPLQSKATSPFEAYREAVAYEDQLIGDVTDVIERHGLSDSTVIVLVGDHGEAFNEHPFEGSAHGSGVYENSMHVPLMLVNPVLFHGERDDRLVQLKDVAPALSWLAGDDRIELNAGRNLFFQKPSEAAYLVNLFSGAFRGGVIVGTLKYHYAAATPSAPERNELFDLATDPNERTDLWPARMREGEQLRDRYFGWLSEWERRWDELAPRTGRASQ